MAPQRSRTLCCSLLVAPSPHICARTASADADVVKAGLALGSQEGGIVCLCVCVRASGQWGKGRFWRVGVGVGGGIAVEKGGAAARGLQ